MRSFPSPRFLFGVLPVLALACGGTSSTTGGGSTGSLPRFASERELTTYLEAASPEVTGGSSSGGSADAGAALPPSEPGASSGASSGTGASPAPANETITNNQEQGVDEGGIVKNIGGALVVLRKGRLYAVSVAQAGSPQQTDTLPVALSDELNKSVWYDEMLVRGDRIYVIGYRYGLKLIEAGASPTGKDATSTAWHGATEVASFRLANGKIERLKSLFLESNDYFSGTNYASRMIDGKLVFYMPHGTWSRDAGQRHLHIPNFFTPNADGSFSKGAPIFTPTDVYVPLDVPSDPVFHTIVKCELPDDGGFTCNARSLLSGSGREHYVTPNAVFLWSLPRAYMFRFEDLGVVAHKAGATPQDQFSFKLDGGVLHMAGLSWKAPTKRLGAEPNAEPPSGPYVPEKVPFVVESLPIADFDVYGEQALAEKERPVVGLDGSTAWGQKQRFVGRSLFIGVSTYSPTDPALSNKLVRFELGSGATTTRDLPGPVVRIEPLGEGRALVAIQSSTALDLESLPVAGPLVPQGSAHVDGLSQGESRSHGFFFKPGSDGGGAFGLPVMNDGGGSGWYGSGISNIGFWSVTPAGGMSGLGIVSSSKEVGICETSCTDWYGNTRPIFLGERAFALMGSELAEISVTPAVGRIGTPAVLGK